MATLDHKIDFAVIFSVTKANPNGDPLNGNRPRQNYDGHGEISDVAIKRKIRNRLQDIGESIFVQSNDRSTDSFKSLRERAEANEALAKIIKAKDGSNEEFARLACEEWIDVRSFGQVFAFKGSGDKGVSVGVRGPVSIHTATSVDPIDITSMQITKSVNSEPGKAKGSDTMGMKHRVDFGVYVFYGSINTQLAEKTGFTNEDAEKIKQALITLFENDASSARPEGSMEVLKVYWWEHQSKLGQYSSAKVHRLLSVKANKEEPRSIEDYTISLNELDRLKVEIIDAP
ncbi:CRISPR-associated protein Cas7/Csd2, subtype I-C/DVULG [Paenibacillus larvae subsp. larvae]|uniref:CRISPR-associated protein Cas7/Csd2, subtype I-C/DVULG n=2 Tax=Paenibacillus larvae TaxID=1464 RepID=A0A2L1UE26_9BACL|nr:type I-C CRISPR-associated protein Cas7/Csd2 [Paenibacillus larvae]AQT83282.1 type I-C CRISPR-associated protein Cas7/Csd2 [Paenibacillus larvae subsp. pulvifaciens]AQZ48401.1 type I-C CRISPR-associated protein Cas7/Csd2 [Paenibacillus larvae subsp. pulvifaciens]ARF70310.1 type I-C CRISPR-associated protein Cas7/Csd2 [Paenibacillus larvae subsp. pulvifaciens]AVF26402.1 CRISPR-associated protein Cas7/Csd2, subtype I-C/DVULG [Paenibacillus larvae subsp. larvae]AVF31179.1 CRISPR-associated pro